MPLFHQSRTCGNCGHEEFRKLPTLIAAFEERREWSDPCCNCGSTSFSSLACELPSLGADILEEWAGNESLTLFQQDEDVLMADSESFELLTRFVQRQDISNSKRVILLSALCILVYDNTPSDEDSDAEIDHDTASLAIQFLSDNHWLFRELNAEYIYDYIKTHVYPKIGLPPPKSNNTTG